MSIKRKMSTPQLFRIDSRQRTAGTESSFSYPAHTSVKFRIATLLSIDIPNAIYPISTSRETDFLRVNQDGVIVDVTIAEGNYSAKEYVIVLQDGLNAAFNSNGLYLVTYDEASYKITVSNNVPIDLLFTQSFDVFRVMGFINNDTGLLLSHTSQRTVDLSGVPYLTFDIHPLPSGSRIVSGVSSTGVYTIPMRVPYGSVNYFEASGLGYELIVYSGVKHNMSNIRVVIYDEFGRIPDLTADWSMLLKLE